MDRKPPTVTPKPPPALEPEDYYFEGPYMVFTAAYHLKRGLCCGSRCRHCPYRGPDAEASAAPAAHSDPPAPEA